MSYFKQFERVKYDPDNIGKNNAVNILNSVVMKYSPIKDTTLYYYYDLADNEKPEDVSFQTYETTEFHWILILLNNNVDPYFDWMLGSTELESYMISKYGNDLYDVHHFTNLQTGRRVDDYDDIIYRGYIDNEIELPHYISPTSNREYEIDMNEEKRHIKVISPQYIYDISKQFEELMSRQLLNENQL